MELLSKLKLAMFSGKKKKPNDKRLEAVRSDFKNRYHSFQALIAANKKAMDTIAELEERLDRRHPAPSNWVQEKTRSVQTSVAEIINNLQQMAPGKYDALSQRFDSIQRNLATILLGNGVETLFPLTPAVEPDADVALP